MCDEDPRVDSEDPRVDPEDPRVDPEDPRVDPEDLRVDLLFEGGGVKGIGLAGGFLELDRRGYDPQCVAGTSAGAITASLIAAGYSGPEVQQVVLEDMQFPGFADSPRFGLLGEAAEVLAHRGLHSGDYFHQWISEKLRAKGLETFGDLRDDVTTDPSRRYRLQVIASDLTDRRMLVLPQDAADLGRDPDRLLIADAVRMSMSIPVFFDPVICDDPHARTKHLIVDGGLLSNYPVWLFDRPEGVAPQFPTFGLLLVAPHQRDPLLAEEPESTSHHFRMPSMLGYVKAIAETMMEAHDRFYVEQANYARTIPIPTLGVTATEFDISDNQARALFDSGVNAAAAFLDQWSFQDYVSRFRSGPPPGRREQLQAG